MNDKEWLKRAIAVSKRSPESVGCGTVLVSHGEIIAEEYSSQRADNVAVNHAEIKAVVAANYKLGSRLLPRTTAYCSCEPCAMCLVALSYAKVERVVFARRMLDVFPDDPQSQLDPYEFVKGLNFVPKIEQLLL